MKKLLIIAACAALMPWCAEAQVEKQVEVTKAYVPNLESATKLAIAPDMTDTVKMRPEIDYTVTPLSLATTLQTRPIRPATVTYWTFNRPQPFYLKVGAGYPLNSVLDFYASTQNPGTGYALGYVNHEGRYADIRNDFGVKNNSLQMFNRVGAAAGKYFGRHTLEGDLSYDNRQYHRYGSYLDPSAKAPYRPGARLGFGDANLDLRFGDGFKDLSRTNFEVALHGNLFAANPELFAVVPADETDISKGFEYRDADGKWGQTTLGAHAKVARAFGRHRLSFEAGYTFLSGRKIRSDYREHLIHAAARYGIDGGVARMEVGADYFHDKTDGSRAGNYILPFAHIYLNLGTERLKPFLEVDGQVRANSPQALAQLNPYVQNGLWADKSSVDYNGRFGISGGLQRDRFSYRVYAQFSIYDNHLYWYSDAFAHNGDTQIYAGGPLSADMARQTVTSFHGEVEYRPVSPLRLTLGARGYLYNDDSKYANGAPGFEGNVGVRYEGRKIAFGVEALLQSERKWSWFYGVQAPDPQQLNTYKTPFGADLRVDFEWKVSGRVSVFAEGRNLLNRKLYQYPWYPQYGVNFTLGAKFNF